LRIFVEAFEVGVGGRGVEVIVDLLYVFPVVTLGAGDAEETLFKDGVFAIPESESEAEVLMVIGDAEETVFGPAIDARACVIVREELPGGSVRAVVFADRAPGALGEIGTPALPVFDAFFRFGEALLLAGDR
jgi:hypothetical protein